MLILPSVLLLLLTFSFVPCSTDSTCQSLVRDVSTCASQGSYGKELYCVAKQNTLSNLMYCVTDPVYYTNDKPFCRQFDSNWQDGGIDDFLWPDENPKSMVCVTPRRVLLARSQADCQICKLTPALRECPVDDPSFLDCVCNYFRTAPAALACFSSCFKQDSLVLGCSGLLGTSAKQRKRSENVQKFESGIQSEGVENRNATIHVSTTLSFRAKWLGLALIINILTHRNEGHTIHLYWPMTSFGGTRQTAMPRIPFLRKSLSFISSRGLVVV